MNPQKRRKRLKKKEFVKNYIHGSEVFYGATPSKQDVASAWLQHKNSMKRKRMKPKVEPEMSKEEFVSQIIRNHEVMFGETPSEKEVNHDWDVIVFQRQYAAIRGKTPKEKREKQLAFLERAEQEMKARYSPAQTNTNQVETEAS